VNQRSNRSLGPGWKPLIKLKYKHMMPADWSTWSQFLASELMRIDELWYDVHVGRPVDMPDDSPEYLIKVAMGVTRKRIDVVVRLGSELSIIEVKPHANMESVGQIATYRDLFKKEFEIKGAIKAVIVAKTCDADILETAEQLGVTIYPMDGVVL